jgi:2-iminoacetate synthase
VLTESGMKIEISISTRENETFRNNIVSLGATAMSAGSKTNPGGYSVDKESLEQFETSDERSMEEIRRMIKKAGYDPMKDWDSVYSGFNCKKSEPLYNSK